MVEALIKKHEAFEKSAATQEERFAALERLTTVSAHALALAGTGCALDKRSTLYGVEVYP